ncbi:MAG: hypothetical protein U9N84_02270, partial [Actinomycetota bacterium]|nr:hypothetical protein [Actinomycetota bacterium]
QQSVISLPFTLFSPVRACFCNSSNRSMPPAQIRYDRATDTLLTGLPTGLDRFASVNRSGPQR